VTLTSDNALWVYDFDASDESSALTLQGPCCDEYWTAPLAPAAGEVRASWSHIIDADPWVDVTLTCMEAPQNSLMGRYGGKVVDDGTVRLVDYGICFEHLYSAPYEQYPPFTYEGAPSFERVKATFYHEGLYVLGPP
jgi:hypothetical protein